jgi:hypothetical protein
VKKLAQNGGLLHTLQQLLHLPMKTGSVRGPILEGTHSKTGKDLASPSSLLLSDSTAARR